MLSGDGYFLALKWSDPDESVTSLKVGLTNSRGTGLVECLDDPDRNGVFKISNKREQRFVILQTAGDVKSRKEYDLSRLTLGDAE